MMEVSQYLASIMIQRDSNKNSMILHQNRHKDQWNRIEHSDINSGSYSHLILDKRPPNIHTDSLMNDAGKAGYLHAED
jgi:hypothetical protein